MAIDNKTIEVERTTSFYIILVEKDGVKKFISKDFYSSCFSCTVLLDKAKKFYFKEQATKFIDDSLKFRDDIKIIKPIEVKRTLKLCE